LVHLASKLMLGDNKVRKYWVGNEI